MSAGTNKSDKHLESTVATWQPYTDAELTEEDAVEIRSNIHKFITLLNRWSKEDAEDDQRHPRAKHLKENA